MFWWQEESELIAFCKLLIMLSGLVYVSDIGYIGLSFWHRLYNIFVLANVTAPIYFYSAYTVYVEHCVLALPPQRIIIVFGVNLSYEMTRYIACIYWNTFILFWYVRIVVAIVYRSGHSTNAAVLALLLHVTVQWQHELGMMWL